MDRLRTLTLFVTVLFLSTVPGPAQVTTATIYGTVLDPTGARIPGASVNLTQPETGALTSKITTETGEFQFDFVRAGSTRGQRVIQLNGRLSF